MDASEAVVLGIVALQALQLAQTAILGRVVRKSLRPPPPPEGESLRPPSLEDTSPGRRGPARDSQR